MAFLGVFFGLLFCNMLGEFLMGFMSFACFLGFFFGVVVPHQKCVVSFPHRFSFFFVFLLYLLKTRTQKVFFLTNQTAFA